MTERTFDLNEPHDGDYYISADGKIAWLYNAMANRWEANHPWELLLPNGVIQHIHNLIDTARS